MASLGKKSDERLSLYLQDFKDMCRRVIAHKRPKKGVVGCVVLYIYYCYFLWASPGLSGILIEPVNEDKAIKCLQRIDLLACIRKEVNPAKTD